MVTTRREKRPSAEGGGGAPSARFAPVTPSWRVSCEASRERAGLGVGGASPRVRPDLRRNHRHRVSGKKAQ